MAIAQIMNSKQPKARRHDAVENGVTDLSGLMLKDRIAELMAIRDLARADTERAEGAIGWLGANHPHPIDRGLCPEPPASGCGPRVEAIVSA